MAEQITVLQAVLDAMRAHASSLLPHECCGLLGGSGDVIAESLPVTNTLASERAFLMDPCELIRGLRTFRERGLDHLGIYHSHPSGANVPSRRDVETAFYPTSAYFIISLSAPVERQVRAFRIVEGRVGELEIEIR